MRHVLLAIGFLVGTCYGFWCGTTSGRAWEREQCRADMAQATQVLEESADRLHCANDWLVTAETVSRIWWAQAKECTK